MKNEEKIHPDQGILEGCEKYAKPLCEYKELEDNLVAIMALSELRGLIQESKMESKMEAFMNIQIVMNYLDKDYHVK